MKHPILPRAFDRLGVQGQVIPLSTSFAEWNNLPYVLRSMALAMGTAQPFSGWADSGGKLETEIGLTIRRVVLQDFTGVPLLVDLAAMRNAAVLMGSAAELIEPLVRVDLVVDHSVQVNLAGVRGALAFNMASEMARNRERYPIIRWGQQAFQTLGIVPPGIGIVHQVNLEYLSKGFAVDKDGVWYPDTLVGTDSHTTMINGVGAVGFGVGGIEAEAAMLGEPYPMTVPEVVGVKLVGKLPAGVTTTDLVLTVTARLKAMKLAEKVVEFYGPGAQALKVADRATLANMAPEYGATMGFFGIDANTVEYFTQTNRDGNAVRVFAEEAGICTEAGYDEVVFSSTVTIDLAKTVPCVAGPKNPDQWVALNDAATELGLLIPVPVTAGGFGVTTNLLNSFPVETVETEHRLPTACEIGHGSILIAAITSCTNTSNPSVMIAAGLLARNARRRGLTVPPHVKTSFGPGSQVVPEYLGELGLQSALDGLGFNVVGFGCTTCIGQSGPLDPNIEEVVKREGLVTASVLSGNRNFEARVHQSLKANYLMSPPLVVAFALAGRMINPETEPLGVDSNGTPVFLCDIWPDQEEVNAMLGQIRPDMYAKHYGTITPPPAWNEVESQSGPVFEFPTAEADNTYIQAPPFFDGFAMDADGFPKSLTGIRPLGIFGDNVTTDHISPAGAFNKASPAGDYLEGLGVASADFDSYGGRRGNDRVMTRGTFANVRIKNLMVPGVEGGVTRCFAPDHDSSVQTSIYDASTAYREAGMGTIIVAGKNYGTGSSRDWAAKGTKLLGVKAVIAESFERIHRSNLCAMGIPPLEWKVKPEQALTGEETFDVFFGELKPGKEVDVYVRYPDGSEEPCTAILRADTETDVDNILHGGVLKRVLRELLTA